MTTIKGVIWWDFRNSDLYPEHLYEMLHFFEFRVARHDDPIVTKSRNEDKTISIGNTVTGLMLCCVEYHIIRSRRCDKAQSFDVGEHLDFLMLAKMALGDVNDFPEIDCVDIEGNSLFPCLLEDADNLLIPVLLLKKFEEGVAVEYQGLVGHYLKSSFRDSRSFLERDGDFGSMPAASLTGSLAGGMR